MTAFANSEAQIGSLTISCELRSVNHRYCNLLFKLPERLRFLEESLHNTITTKIKRGKIECSLNYKKHQQNQQIFNLNISAVTTLLKATSEIESLMNNPARFSALDILTFSGIQQDIEIDDEDLKQGVTQLVKTTLIKMIATREREGFELKNLLAQRCQKMNDYVDIATQRMPHVLELINNKMAAKINELKTEVNSDRFEQEIVFMIQKLDISEELERLKTHIGEVNRVLQQKMPVGRRLDFLMQEMNREANTLAAKSADKEITQISIELKVLIEQMREQIQNIE